MNLPFEKITFRFFNLCATFLLLLVFSQCVSKEEEIIPAQELSSDYLDELENRPKLEDPDPLIEDPDYGELFSPNQSLNLLEELISVSANGEELPAALALLEKMGANVPTIDSEMVSYLRSVDVDFILGLMDPETPLDPEMEDFLQKMLQKGNLNLATPEAMRVEGLLALDVLRERKPEYKAEMTEGYSQDYEEYGGCPQYYFGYYGSGAYACEYTRVWDLSEVEYNYNRRMDEADQRFQDRNGLIKNLYKNVLAIKATILAEIGRSIQYMDDPLQAEAIQTQIKYFGLVYAYYIRTQLSTIYESGLLINHLYFQNEIKLITDLRDQKIEETNLNAVECMNWINGLIIDDVNRFCPGEEPITWGYTIN